MGIDWKQKLSSRKLWALMSALATAIMVLYNYGDAVIVQVTTVIGSFGAIVAYIFGESSIDAARAQGDTKKTTD